MATIRRDMQDNVDDIVENAKELADWRRYVRSAPWVAMGAAAAIGFLAVPKKLKVMSPDPDTLADLAKDNRLVVEHKPEAAARSGVAHSAFTMLSSMVLRATMAYAGQKLGRIFGEQAAEPSTGEQGTTP